MVSENLKEWVKSKRKDGVSDERIKKSLEETDHDPSIVDELDNPFNSETSERENSEEKEKNSEVLEDDFSFTDEEDTDNETTEEAPPKEDNKETNSRLKELENDFQTSITTTKDSFSKKKAGLGILLILLIAGGITVYGFMPDDFNLLESVDEETGPESGSLEQLDTQHSGCPDSAVRVQSVSSSDGVTTADVQVTREEALVVLKVMKDGEVLGFTTDTLLGEAQMTVEEVGDQVKLRPLGCKDRYSLRDY